MPRTQRIKLIAVALAVAAFIGTERAQPAPSLSDLCLATLSEIRLLAPEFETACMLRVGKKGFTLAFTTNAPLFEDPTRGKTYLSFLFGSLGKSLARSGRADLLEEIEITNPALVRNGQRFKVNAGEIRSISRKAPHWEPSLSGFYEALIQRGRLVDY